MPVGLQLFEGYKLDFKLDFKLEAQMRSASSRGRKALCPWVPCEGPTASKNCRYVPPPWVPCEGPTASKNCRYVPPSSSTKDRPPGKTSQSATGAGRTTRRTSRATRQNRP